LQETESRLFANPKFEGHMTLNEEEYRKSVQLDTVLGYSHLIILIKV